jgi:hypothetical protein
MIHVSFDPYRLTIHEPVGIAHECQVVEIPVPESSPDLFHLRDESTGQLYPIQTSQARPGRGYLLLSLEPDQILALVPCETAVLFSAPPISITEGGEVWTVETRNLALELSSGSRSFEKNHDKPVAGPVRRVREAGGPWRGRTFFDTAGAALREEATWLEKGPLRSVYHYRIEFEKGGFYELDLTIDAPLDFVRLHETFRGAASDQIVWDFAGGDLPERLSLLDPGAGWTARWLHYHLDQRQARLWCWTQFSQLHDLSDGFALHFSGADDVVGLVSMAGGDWKGNALNHLEGWTRRWEASDLTTRRLPAETKADSFPGIDAIPARGKSVNDPHFTWEGWLRRGERRFALVLSTAARLAPQVETLGAKDEQGCSVALGHFETVPRRDLYRKLQGRLRKIHIQHGLFSLQNQIELSFEWPLEPNFSSRAEFRSTEHRHACAVGRIQHGEGSSELDEIKRIDDFLQARVFGFWESSGAAYTNCVVSRRVGPDMLHFEELVRDGKLPPGQIKRWRAWFAFLAHLYHSDHFYPGASTMEPVGAVNSVEPTMAGMSNQNFYTDVIALFAFAGQVFPEHPSAPAWREKFRVDWKRQLDYHMYPKSGVWEESHTYYQHILATLLPLFLRQRADGAGDEFADPAFQKLVAGALAQMAPRNAVVGGNRHIIPFGDHAADPKTYRPIYRELALALASHAPALAGHLAWVYREMKGEELPEVPAIQPTLSTGYQEGLGFLFRGNIGTDAESLLAFRSGMAWAHHHNDDGSIQFYAHGRALIVDSASSQPQERSSRKALSPGQSRAAIEGIEPLNHLWRFNRGWILEARPEGKLAYAVAGTPTFATIPKGLPAAPLTNAFWELRAVVEIAPTVYLIADYLDVSHRHLVRFHVAHQTVTLEGNRIAAAFGTDCRLEIIPLSPVEPPALSLDRPLNPARIPQEITTSVEYGGVTGPWSLFLVAALGPTEPLKVSIESALIQITTGDRPVKIQWENDRLEILAEGGVDRVSIDAPTLLSQLRAGSR